MEWLLRIRASHLQGHVRIFCSPFSEHQCHMGVSIFNSCIGETNPSEDLARNENDCTHWDIHGLANLEGLVDRRGNLLGFTTNEEGGHVICGPNLVPTLTHTRTINLKQLGYSPHRILEHLMIWEYLASLLKAPNHELLQLAREIGIGFSLDSDVEWWGFLTLNQIGVFLRCTCT
ncbi:hypothetical protein FGO68_gene7598 [Halteria grandinella]|uniref:Uncharacterized protein n=1 Tax=Halteria grandinella TaxID=5974 RepID=A0A8J8SZ36_HALGN|nr:hypothetical protein FGO68_gene7598 [Halteria grandinella]